MAVLVTNASGGDQHGNLFRNSPLGFAVGTLIFRIMSMTLPPIFYAIGADKEKFSNFVTTLVNPVNSNQIYPVNT